MYINDKLIFKSLFFGFIISLSILVLAAICLDSCTKYIHTEKTITVKDTVPTLIEKEIQISTAIDTSIQLPPWGLVNLHIHNSKLSFDFHGQTIHDTIEHITQTIPQATIRQMQETIRAQYSGRERTIRDSLDNIRKMYGDSLTTERKIFSDSVSALVKLAKQTTKQVQSNNNNGFWQRLKNDWWFICIGIVIGFGGPKLIGLAKFAV